jgi:hypothetical protein
VGAAKRGGIRIAGDGFDERTVSITDVAWVVVADERREGGLLDEALVNRHRYLEGTPKGSTRWIDTGWALAAWNRARPLVPTTTETMQIAADDAQLLDARFAVEERAGVLSVIVESRGGTKGSPAARNMDYHAGVELLLARLRAAGAQLADALVESATTLDLPPDQRRLTIAERPYPLSIDDPAELRRALGREQARVGREESARGGGNQTKRIRLVLRFAGAAPTAEMLATKLAGT